MQAETRLTQEQVQKIIAEHYKAKNFTVKRIRIGYENYGGDPRESPYGFVDVTFEMPDP